MQYPFGRDIQFKWYPLSDDVELLDFPVQGASLNIYVYATESRPTLSEARTGTNKTGAAITSWTAIPSGFQFVIPAISDIDPTSETRTRVFWVAINYILKTGGQVQTVVEPLVMTRAFGQQSAIGVAPADLIALYPGVSGYATEADIAEAIAYATEMLKAYLKAGRFYWAQIKDPESLATVIKVRAMMHIEFNQSQGQNDQFDRAYKEHQKEYDALIKSLELAYDADKDNKADEQKAAIGGYSFGIR